MTVPADNKKKILNDPVYGFISIPYEEIHDLIAHPYFQRLRRIKQVGMTHLVYPGALHTRFHHALGAMHLMYQAIQVIRSKGHAVTQEEEKGACMAILLHDIGHGPFSHSLEFALVDGISHEKLSLFFMERLNEEMKGALKVCIEIFTNRYPKKFLHQLVSSQLDMDRLDYLSRDSFFTGVSEGVVSNQRIIKMLNVVDDELVVEEKGIYSIEKFVVARRLMYWQVYLHKTVIAAEQLLIRILKRAKELAVNGTVLFGSPPLLYFLKTRRRYSDFMEDDATLVNFALLDDNDIMGAIKVWQFHQDKILSDLSQRLINRHLFRVRLSKTPFGETSVAAIKNSIREQLDLSEDDLKYYLISGSIANNAYDPSIDRINILMKNGKILDLVEASDTFTLTMKSPTVKKYFLCYPKEIALPAESLG